MTSVERVVSTAATLPAEAPAVMPEADAAAAAAGWPAAGRVEFQDVTMAYRPGLPPALKGTLEGIGARGGAGRAESESSAASCVWEDAPTNRQTARSWQRVRRWLPSARVVRSTPRAPH